MNTEIIKINPDKPELLKLIKIGTVIKRGGLVVIPTDTVYGLTCDVTNPKAVKKVYKVKERPLTQPLSIAINKFKDFTKYVSDIPACAWILAKAFLPGPLTLILKKTKLIPDIVTSGRDDVGIRIPDCQLILMLIDAIKVPIVIPSANIHNKPSPTTAEQALKDLNGKVDLIIDGGKTKYGIESTIVSCIDNKIKILREGAIPKEKIFSSLLTMN